jgi:UDP-N-acetylmuramoyl-tripeptide--D-alanyl-D-alanine ligase
MAGTAGGASEAGWTAADVAAAAGARLEPPEAAGIPVTGAAAVDSRHVAAGGLFVAVKGEHVDGYDFARPAAHAGASLVLADRAVVGVPTVVADDVVVALGRVARAWLDRLNAVGRLDVVAVTGSSGKTTTKDLLAAVLARAGSTVATPESYNNELGLPLTVLSAAPGTRFLVLEMGARGPGHLTELTRIAPPNVAVVLNVGSAHAGEFGSPERTAQAKGELVAALPPDGVAVLNADDGLVAAMSARTTARVVTYGTARGADVRAGDVRLEAGRARFTLTAGTAGSAPVALRVVGAHQVANALAVAAVGVELGLTVATVAEALSAAEPSSRWRMQVTDRTDGVTVVNDAYNANPDSVRAAVEALVAIAGTRRTWAVLGEMLELGDTAASAHEAAGRLVAALGVARLVAVGPGARPVLAGALLAPAWTGESVYVDDTDAALALLRAALLPGDVVLVKASRGAGLERVALRLAEESTP